MESGERFFDPPPQERGRLLTPAVSCPGCGSRPAFRVSERLRAVMDGEPPQERVGSYKCQRRSCGIIYDISVAAVRGAD